MGFSPAQQGKYRPLVKKAWATHCERTGTEIKDKTAYDSWYEGVLMQAIGRTSTADANKGRDFDHCRAHFEAICADSIDANMEVFIADSKRIIWLITQICEKDGVHHAYVLGTARKIVKNPRLQSLAEIGDLDQLDKVRIALVMHAKRKAKEEENSGNPF